VLVCFLKNLKFKLKCRNYVAKPSPPCSKTLHKTSPSLTAKRSFADVELRVEVVSNANTKRRKLRRRMKQSHASSFRTVVGGLTSEFHSRHSFPSSLTERRGGVGSKFSQRPGYVQIRNTARSRKQWPQLPTCQRISTYVIDL
jgi:hypothetical protein